MIPATSEKWYIVTIFLKNRLDSNKLNIYFNSVLVE